LLSALAPTAAEVLIGGRIVTPEGRGLFGARVVMTDAGGNVRYAMTNPLGFYRFADVRSGETYVLSPSHKRFVFTPQIVFVGEELGNLNFTAQAER
jgi:hypothetical protein